MADAVADTAFDLRAHGVRIYGDAAIHGGGDFLNHDAVVVVARNFHHFCHVGAEGFVHGDALGTTGRRIAPARFFRRQFQHSRLTRSVAFTGQIGQAEVYRILTSGFRCQIHHHFHHIGRVGVAHRAPPQNAGRFFGVGEAERLAWDGVGAVGNAFDRRVVNAIMDRHRLKGSAFHDGLACDLMIPADDCAVFIQTDPHLMAHGRAVVAAADVVFAVPNQFHRAGAIGHHKGQTGLDLIVGIRGRATAKGATSQHAVDLDLLRRQLEDLLIGHVGACGHLCAVMQHDFALCGLLDGAIQRLHRGMGQKREVEGFLHHRGRAINGGLHRRAFGFVDVVGWLSIERRHDLVFDLRRGTALSG